MVECNYCDEVFCAASKQGTTRLWNHYHAFHDENKGKPNITKLKGADWKYDEETSIRNTILQLLCMNIHSASLSMSIQIILLDLYAQYFQQRAARLLGAG
jgi:hypothetical protein